ncbi:MAG: putative RNA 2'-phosphotransferase [Planctomycetota bacterium]|jgi:putative RNA 2'-phosphotransferase
MVMSHDSQRTSKLLSYVLRHRPDEIGMQLDEHGWIDITELIAAATTAGKPLTREDIDEAVRNNDKQRFRISTDGTRIRANQGNSVDIKTARLVDGRDGRPVVLVADTAAMHANGHTFFCSENGVWLTNHVPIEPCNNSS